MVAIPASYYGKLPPAVTDDYLAYALSLGGLLIVSFCFLDWTYRFGWELADDRRSRHHPLTVLRVILFTCGVSGVIRNLPDVFLWGMWKVSSPLTRYNLAHWNRILDALSAPFQVASNVLLVVALPVLAYQLQKQPIPIELYPSRKKIYRQIGMASFGMLFAFAIALF